MSEFALDSRRSDYAISVVCLFILPFQLGSGLMNFPCELVSSATSAVVHTGSFFLLNDAHVGRGCDGSNVGAGLRPTNLITVWVMWLAAAGLDLAGADAGRRDDAQIRAGVVLARGAVRIHIFCMSS